MGGVDPEKLPLGSWAVPLPPLGLPPSQPWWWVPFVWRFSATVPLPPVVPDVLVPFVPLPPKPPAPQTVPLPPGPPEGAP
jgi:hypothetical protein